jgi:hypothetical protein
MSTPAAHFNPRHLNAPDLTARLAIERHRLQSIESAQRRLRQIRSTLNRTQATLPVPPLQLSPQPLPPPQCWLSVKSQAILMSPHPAAQPPLEWCSIPLEAAFGCPSTLALLAPAEHSGIFKSPRHQAGYEALVAAWVAKKEQAARRENEELREEKLRLQKERAEESEAFHTEFLRLLRWGEKGVCLRPAMQPIHWPWAPPKQHTRILTPAGKIAPSSPSTPPTTSPPPSPPASQQYPPISPASRTAQSPGPSTTSINTSRRNMHPPYPCCVQSTAGSGTRAAGASGGMWRSSEMSVRAGFRRFIYPADTVMTERDRGGTNSGRLLGRLRNDVGR